MLRTSNLSHDRATMLSRNFGLPITSDLGKYFGVPMKKGRLIKETYIELISKIKSRLDSWSKRHMSMAGRLTLIQSVSSTMSSYLMQTTYFLAK